MRKSVPLMLLLLSGCMSSHGVRPLRPQELATAPYQGVVTAAFTGSLLYEGGCLLFRDDQNRVQLLPFWPTGSVFNGTSVLFHQPGKADQRVVVGEEFMMEGQPPSWSAMSASSFEPFHRQCGAQPFFVSRITPAN